MRGGTRWGRKDRCRLLERVLLDTLEPRRLLSVSVLTYHNDLARDGLNSNEVSLTPANVNSSSFGELLSYPVTGQVYAQPLYVPNLNIPGKGVRNVVFVVTMDNDVYAFDANSNAGVGAGVLWHVNLGTPAAVPSPFIGFRYGPDHDTTPLVGITSTPVIDLATNTMYLDAFTNDVVGQDAYSHHIHALDLTTGADKITPMLVQAAVAGNGVGGDGTTVTFAADRQLQRVGLTLLNGVVYASYGAFADTDPYHGWILGFDENTLQLVSVMNTTPNLDTDANEGESGLWQSGNALASDGTYLFGITGNGDFNPAVGDYGDTILKVQRDSSTITAPNITGYGLSVADYFTPFNQQALADADADLGSGGAMILPTQPGAYPDELVGAGKQGIVYLVNRDNMSGYHATDMVIQTVSLGHGMWGSPAYFNGSIYYHAVGDVLKRYALTNGLLSAAPAAQSTIVYNSQGGTPSVSANGTANGIVWDVEWDATHQVLHAYDATTLAELYNSNQNAARDQMGAGVKFITPTIADGEVFVGTSNSLNIYGLLVPVTTPPAAPSNLAAAALNAFSIALSWVDNANNESGFKIERSTDGVSYTQIALVSANTTSYTDSTVNAVTQYYYRIRATNVIGDSAYTDPAIVTTPAAAGASDVYHFDDGSGTTALDSAGGVNGTLVGTPLPTWISAGEAGGAISFSGDGVANQTTNESAVQVGTDLSTILGASSTLDVWVKTTQTGNALHYDAPAITGADQASGNNDIDWGTLDATGHIGLYVGDSGGVYSTYPINDGQWHNVAITRDAVTGTVSIYIDGVLNATAILDTGAKTTSFFLIGALSVVANNGTTRTGGNYFNGQLDELRIYNEAIGSSQIAGLAVRPAAPILQTATAESGPVIHLAFTSPSNFADSVEVDRKIGVNGTYAAVATLPSAATMYDDTNVANGISYYYVIKAIDTAGASAASNELSVIPPAPTIVARTIFYNNSSFDGQNGSSNLTDVAAIAPDKLPLLPGHSATFQNYSSYAKGLNGIMVDVANLVVLPRLDDFEFMVGNNNDPSTWTQAPTPTFLNTYPGRGPGGSTQITVIWNDNAIQNEWLQVTVLAQPHLGLLADDVFYFGSDVGDTGDSSTDAQVTAADAAAVSAHETASAGVSNIYDINRDGKVDQADVDLVNANLTPPATALTMLTLPGTVPTVVNAAAAVPNPTATTTATLSVLGNDDAGEANLTYTWTTVGAPPAAVSFSVNGTNAAKSTTATFSKAGTYTFQVTMTNPAQLSTTSTVTVTVNQTTTSVAVSPASATLAVNGSMTFAATALDQFGNAMASQPAFGWTMAGGGGSITTGGVYTAPRTAGTASVRAAIAGGPSGVATITVFYDALAWYQADASTGTTLADSSVFNQTATLTGAAAFGGGVSGNALALTGGYASLPTGIVGSLNDFTIAAWVKVTTLAAWARIFDFGSSTNVNMFLTADAGDTGALRFAITLTGNPGEQRVDGPAMAVNTWTHVAITLAGNTATMYINGVAYASNTGVTLHPTNLGATTQNYLGKSQYADPALTGSIDDFRLYSYALSAQQIQQLALPAVVTAAAAAANPVTTASTTLSVLGSDVTAGEAGLTYTWATTGAPPAPVNFSINGTNAAKNTVATFPKPGIYNFVVTMVNPVVGFSTTSNVSVTVVSTFASIAIVPASAAVAVNGTQQFGATALDQFGVALAVQPSFTWSIFSGGGTISSGGLYTAPGSLGSAVVQATSGAISNTAAVTISNDIPTVATAASATPNPVTGTTTALSVLGADLSGEASLTYMWATIGTPPAAVGFSANGTNASKHSTATFSAAGSYVLQVTITNGVGFSVTSTVNVTVNQTLTSVAVAPGAATVQISGTAQFGATALDQFGAALAVQPAFTWTVSAGAGSINASGLYTAPAAAGSATVRAAVSAGPSGTASVTIVSLVAWYQANASSGTVLADSSGNNQNGALSGAAAFAAGVSGNALALTGGYATLPTGVVSALSDFTIAAWVKVTAQANWSRFFDFGTGTTDYMFLTSDPGGNNAFRYAITVSGNGNEQQLNGPAIALNTWTHVAITLAGTTGTMYVNGVAVATNTNMTLHPSSLGSTTQNYLGKSQFAADAALQGSIDDFRIYNVALSAQQVLQLAAPTVVTAAAAAASPVVTTSTNLSVLGADVTGGEPSLTYTWATTGTPPAGVTFSVNGTNAAKNTVATFTRSGTYNFTVTVTNAGNLTATSAVQVIVAQTPTSISVAPGSTTVSDGLTGLFTTTVLDQFAQSITAPAVTWSLDSGSAGSINAATGLYTAPASGPGTATVRATSGAVSSTAAITVNFTTLMGTANGDTFTLVRDIADNTMLDIILNSTFWSVPYSSVTSPLTISGLAGDDHLLLNFLNGNPVPAGGVSFDGGGHVNGDTVQIKGASAADAFALGASTITHGAATVSYTNVQSFDLTAGTFTLNFPGNGMGLTLESGATAVVPAAASSATHVLMQWANLTINTGGMFNLNNNDMIVANTPVATLYNAITTGQFFSGSANSSNGLTGLGSLAGSAYLMFHPAAQLDGVTVKSTDAVIKYTYRGDAYLNGAVTASSFGALDGGFLLGATPSWINGDFNNDGTLDYRDYTAIDYAFAHQGAPLADAQAVTAGPTLAVNAASTASALAATVSMVDASVTPPEVPAVISSAPLAARMVYIPRSKALLAAGYQAYMKQTISLFEEGGDLRDSLAAIQFGDLDSAAGDQTLDQSWDHAFDPAPRGA